MKRIFLALAGLLATLVLLVIAGLLYLTLVLDPNDLRPQIERLAREQGLPLQLQGPLAWQWWPQLGLSAEQVSVTTPGTDESLLDAQRLAAVIAIRPLLRGEVTIAALEFDGVVVNLLRDRDGRGNWERLLEAAGSDTAPPVSPPASQPAMDESPASVSLVIDRLRLTRARLHYQDLAQDTHVSLEDLNLSIDNLDLQGQLFDWQQSALLKLDQQPPITIASSGRMSFDLDSQVLQLQPLTLELSANQSPLKLEVTGRVQLDELEAELLLDVPPVNLDQWLTQLGVSLPEMAAADALSKVSFSSRLTGGDSGWRLDDLSLQLDQTRFAGHAAYSDTGAIALVLNGDQLDLDRYLPVPADEVASAAAASSSGQADKTGALAAGDNSLLLSDEPLDLSGLRELEANIALSLDRLIVRQLPLQTLVLKAGIRDGQALLDTFSARVAEGQLALSGKLDARTDNSSLALAGDFRQLQLQPVLATVMEEERLTGRGNGQLQLTARGESLRAWQQTLDGWLQLNAAELQLASLDVERSACELAALVNNEPVPDLPWKGHTPMQDLQTRVTLKGTRINIESLQAGIENLQAKASGGLDYLSGDFDVPVSILFTGQADPERECQIRDRWRNRDLPLRCKGNLDSVSARSCGPDIQRLNALLGEEIKQRATDKATEKLQEKLQDKLGDEQGEAVQQLLRGLLRKPQQDKPAEPAPAEPQP